VKKERDCRRKPQKERGKTTLNVSKTSCKKATSELAHNRYQTTALVDKAITTGRGGERWNAQRPDRARPDRTGQETHGEKQMSTSVFCFGFLFLG
jgi:hypothetical protein